LFNVKASFFKSSKKIITFYRRLSQERQKNDKGRKMQVPGVFLRIMKICSDGSVYPGTFTATKTSGGSVDSVPESDGVDPQ
jgi:hypothetical protein